MVPHRHLSTNGLEVRLTQHAMRRMGRRGISGESILTAIQYGREAFVRGARIYAIGRKEVEHYGSEGIDLARYEGVQVVCAGDGLVLTIYRNRDFRGLRPRGRSRRRCAA